MRQLRFGFVGLGAMGFSHLKAFADHHAKQVEITALCARDAGRIRRARELAPGAALYAEAEELIDSALDAVVVSTPNFTHCALTEMTLQAGKHLFLEKPIGISSEQCRQIVRQSERSDRVVMIGHELRYSPFFQRIKQFVDQGLIGAPKMVWCREFRGPFQKKSQDWIEDDRRSGGALVLQSGAELVEDAKIR